MAPFICNGYVVCRTDHVLQKELLPCQFLLLLDSKLERVWWAITWALVSALKGQSLSLLADRLVHCSSVCQGHLDCLSLGQTQYRVYLYLDDYWTHRWPS